MIKAVFLDFDSTTFSHVTKKIPDSAFNAITKAQARGIKIFLSTGRDIKQIQDFDCQGIKFDGYVLDNGQLLLDKDLNILEVIYMEGNNREQVLDWYKNKKMPIMIQTREEGYVNYLSPYAINILKSADSDMPPVKEMIDEEILVATVFLKNEEERKYIIDSFKDANVTWWHPLSCDIVPKNANKMRGILKILDLYKYNLEEILAVGDGENDIEMIEAVPHSVAMGNSVQLIKDAAEFITTDIDDDGIEKAFIKYKLI